MSKAQVFDELVAKANRMGQGGGADAHYDIDADQEVVRLSFGRDARLDPANYLRGAFDDVTRLSLGWDRYKIVEVRPYQLRVCRVLRDLLTELKIGADILVEDPHRVKVVCKDPKPSGKRLRGLERAIDSKAGIGSVIIE